MATGGKTKDQAGHGWYHGLGAIGLVTNPRPKSTVFYSLVYDNDDDSIRAATFSWSVQALGIEE